MTGIKRVLPVAIALLLVVVGGVWLFTGGNDQKTLTAYFPRAISLYEGSDVRVLGVPVGTVETVEPVGTRVKVTLKYDREVKIPANASAMIVSPSIVGDRYVQLTPAYAGEGKLMADGTVLEESRTGVPLELDEIFGSLDRLTVALGPDGANSKGALSDLLEQTARNFGGQGATFKQTVEDFSQLSRTLDDNKDELFGATAELQSFLSTLADNDTTVRDFNTSLGDVSEMLSGEREDLAAALAALGVALEEVGGFVEENRDALGRNIRGLNRVSKVLVRQRGALEEVLEVAPVALSNLGLTYNPDAGTLDTNANLTVNLDRLTEDPLGFFCSRIGDNPPISDLCDLLGTAGGQNRPAPGTQRGVGGPPEFDPTLHGLVGTD